MRTYSENRCSLEHLGHESRDVLQSTITCTPQSTLESKIGNVASKQGTKHPVCAVRAMTPTCEID
jgi:hypothetical protein